MSQLERGKGLNKVAGSLFIFPSLRLLQTAMAKAAKAGPPPARHTEEQYLHLHADGDASASIERIKTLPSRQNRLVFQSH
jgi:hypothetical protein